MAGGRQSPSGRMLLIGVMVVLLLAQVGGYAAQPDNGNGDSLRGAAAPKFSRAVVEGDKGFLLYENVDIIWTRGHNPDMYLYNEENERVDTIDLSPYNFTELHDLMRNKGFRRRVVTLPDGQKAPAVDISLVSVPQVNPTLLRLQYVVFAGCGLVIVGVFLYARSATSRPRNENMTLPIRQFNRQD